jgi:mono/diheme cytochrome c family protein
MLVNHRRIRETEMHVLIIGVGLFVLLTHGFAVQAPQQPPSILIESLAGRDSFALYCASCHGTTGRGDGPVAGALRRRPADLTTIARRSDGAFPSDTVRGFITGTGRTVAAHGTAEMPVWGPLFRAFESDSRTRLRIENLVTYIESIQVPSTGSKDLGSQLFKTHCATCHGSAGRGDGPMADQLRRMPPDLTKYTARNGGVFPRERVYRIVDGRDVSSHGDRDMPVWGDVFKQTGRGAPDDVKARIEAIVRYLEGIQERAAD